jgi:DNA-binding HxlR family transcriptional regulator
VEGKWQVARRSTSITTKELRELESWSLTVCRNYEVVPPRTDYCRTELGRPLEPLMVAMAEWGLKHRGRILGGEGRAGGHP